MKEAEAFQQMLMRTTTYGISESEFLQHLEAAFGPPSDASKLGRMDPLAASQLVLGLEPSNFISHFEDNGMRDITWADDPRFQVVTQAVADRAKSLSSSSKNNVEKQSDVVEQMNKATTLPAKREVAARAVHQQLSQLLSVQVDEIDGGRPMAHYGLDSLVAAELRNWLATTFRVQIPLVQMLSPTTKIQDLVDKLVVGEGLEKKENGV